MKNLKTILLLVLITSFFNRLQIMLIMKQLKAIKLRLKYIFSKNLIMMLP